MPVCARCGRDNPEGARFCNSCGAELAPASATVLEELKVVTVLFADITGSTALGERLDAEGLKEVTGTFFAAMREEIEAEGGTVEKYIGDAVMAAFGVPRVHEDDPARALRAALRMQSRLRRLNATLAERHDVALELRIGVNTGPVMAVLEPRPGEALATGDAVNAAARLEQAARPGQVLVAERTAQAARHFRFGPVSTLAVRGKAEPLRVLELEAEQPLTEGTLAGTRTPLVGRRRELELLTTTYHRVVEEERPHLVTVYGDAGVGKSRLVGELLAGLETGDPAPRILRGRCLAYGDGISFWPLAEMLKAHARVLDTDAAGAAQTQVADAAAASLAAAGVDAAGELAALLTASIGLGGDDGTERGAAEQRAETALAWRSFFSALADATPTIAVVEDVHWADAAALGLLEDVAAHAAGPLLVLCTARPELTARRPTWGGGRRSFTGLAVEPLDAADSARLADHLLGDGVADDARAAIVARAEGNPFFLEEIVRVRDGDHALPDSVRAALASRVDLLPADEKRVLQTAAVIGRVFWPAAVAQIAALGEAEVDLLLDRLQDRDLVLSRLGSSMRGQRELIFRHALICEVAYESLPRRDRVRMHVAVADWIDATYADRRAEVVELLAHHRLAAQRLGPSETLREGAFAALAEAAETAYGRAVFERAVSLARDALDVAGTPLEQARALEVLGHASIAHFDGSTAWESLCEAADIVREHAPADRRRLAALCGTAALIPIRAAGLMRTGPDPEEVARYLQIGLACADDVDGEALVMLLAAEAFWTATFEPGAEDPDGVRAQGGAERAREIARELGRRDLEAIAIDAIGAAALFRGHFGIGAELDRERLAVARIVRDPYEALDGFYVAAWNAFETGHFRRVLDLRAEFEALDPGIFAIGPTSLSALALLRLGEWDEALAMNARMRAFVGDGALPGAVGSGGYGAEAFILDARGDRAAADAVLDEIRGWTGGNERQWRWALGTCAVIQARRGDHAEAARLIGFLDDGMSRGRALEAHCALIAERGAWDEAAGVVARARAHAADARLVALPLHADLLEGRARAATGDPQGALAPLERAAAGFAALGAVWNVAQAELELGALGRPGAAARAGTVFERLGVPRELARARSLGG